MVFGQCKTVAELQALNEHLKQYTYVGKHVATSEDAEVYAKISKLAPGKYKDLVALNRWAKHMHSYSQNEMKQFQTVKKNKKAATPKKAQDTTPKKEASDDVDLFGSDDSEDSEAEEARKEALRAAKAKPAKKGVINKSQLVYMIQANPDETDYEKVVNLIKGIEMEGVTWGANYKTVPIAFGLQKIQYTCTIIDDIVDTGKVTEEILRLGLDKAKADERMRLIDIGEDEDDDEEYYIATAEIASFNKL